MVQFYVLEKEKKIRHKRKEDAGIKNLGRCLNKNIKNGFGKMLE